jgi:hypothetical protein
MITRNKRIIIGTDMDEVLTNISPLWVSMIHKNQDYFGKYFKLINNFNLKDNYNQVLSRPEYNIEKWFMKKDYVFESEEEKLELNQKFLSLYDHDGFYDMCIPTKISHAFKYLLLTEYVQSIYIITKVTSNTIESKKRFIEKYIGKIDNKKLFFVPLKLEEKKSDVIKRLNIQCDAFFEDEMNNIIDILFNTFNNQMDMYIPSLGYNKFDFKDDEKKYNDFLEKLVIAQKTIQYYH